MAGFMMVKGQEVSLDLIGPGGPIASLKKFQNFSITWNGEIITIEVLGEPVPFFDDISNGVSIKARSYPDDPSVFNLIEQVETRRRHSGPSNITFSAQGRFIWPDGRVSRLIVPDIKWGDFPVSIGGRREHVTLDLDGRAREVITR